MLVSRVFHFILVSGLVTIYKNTHKKTKSQFNRLAFLFSSYWLSNLFFLYSKMTKLEKQFRFFIHLKN